jgi:hypothetical protein
MNKTKQFWALFRFQTTVNPFIWLMPIVFGLPLFITGDFPSSYHPNFSSLLTVQNLFFVGIFGTFVLAPEKFLAGPTHAAFSSSGTEFLLTRAIDRSLLYRSKATFFYILILLIPLITLLQSLKNPDLKVTEYSKLGQQLCLSHVTGSMLEPDPSGNRWPLIAIPGGNVLIEKWHFWLFVIAVLIVQALILLLYPFRYRWLFLYAIFMSFIFVPLLIDLHHIREQVPSHMERLFFSFAAHQTAFWILTGLILILGQLWCERRFARLEQ